MSCKSALYTANTTPQTVAVGSTIALGTIIRRFGCGANLSGNAVSLTSQGYYDVDVSVTAVPTAAGTVTVTLLQDGVAIPGATASATVDAAATSVNLNISAIARLAGCNCSVSNLTLLLTGATSIVTNAAVTVEKL